jgi:hypothetical protein
MTCALQLELVLMVLPQMMFVLLMLSLLVIAYAAFGPSFGRPDVVEDDYYFNSFSQSIWSIFVAITSSSWPGQILPSYNSFREVCLFFVSFICLGSYVLLNIIIIGEFHDSISDFIFPDRISVVFINVSSGARAVQQSQPTPYGFSEGVEEDSTHESV